MQNQRPRRDTEQIDKGRRQHEHDGEIQCHCSAEKTNKVTHKT